MRKPIIAGNWKMNNTNAEAKSLILELAPLVKGAKCEVVICVPFTCLMTAAKAIKGTKIRLGAQNISFAPKGAYTGEISAAMLKELNVKYAIVGHSERRQMFGETDTTVGQRAVQAVKNDIVPIICVGETWEEREQGLTQSVVSRQIEAAFCELDKESVLKTVVAYEPVWAIGTGKTATAADADQTIKFIRKQIARLFDKSTASKLRIQYGGSMNAANADELMAMKDIDGGLIGGASLKAADFAKIVGAAAKK